MIESRRWSDRNDVVQPDVIEWMYTCDLGSDVGGGGVSQGYEE